MRQGDNFVEIGIERPEFGGPEDAPKEIEAIRTVMGGIDEGLEELVTVAREACPNPNCCLTAVATSDSAEGGSWDPHPMNDTTYEVSFTKVKVGSKRLIDCAERAERLTEGIGSMVQTCIDATGKADAAAKKKTDAAGKKAKRTTNTAAVKKARATVQAAQDRASEIKAEGETDAQAARDSVYAQTRKEITAPLTVSKS